MYIIRYRICRASERYCKDIPVYVEGGCNNAILAKRCPLIFKLNPFCSSRYCKSLPLARILIKGKYFYVIFKCDGCPQYNPQRLFINPLSTDIKIYTNDKANIMYNKLLLPIKDSNKSTIKIKYEGARI